MKAIHRAVLALVLPLGLLACGSKGSGSGESGASTGPGGAAGGKGIDAAGNDPAVVALAKKALGCKWGDYGFPYDCADRKAWDESELLKGGKADPTLVAMLEDANEQVRWLAAAALSSNGDKYRTDKALAERVINAALAEKSKPVARNIGNAAGKVKLTDVGLVDKAKPIGKVPMLKEMRLGFIDSVQFNNKDAFYAYTVDLAKNGEDKEIRDAAMSAFWTGTPNGKNAEVCALWYDLSHDANEELAAHADYFVAFYPFDAGCKAQWDGMLGDIEKRAKAGTAKSSYWGSALYYMFDQKAASPAQKKKAEGIAKAMAENTANGASARVRAMEFLTDKTTGVKPLLQKLEKDSDSYVKSRATDLLKKAK